MNHLFLLRLALDFIAAGLLLAGLAYYWLDNVAHELIGTGMFLLIIVHNVFNRRWYGTATKSGRDVRRAINAAIIVALLAAMLTLLITSLMISKSVFSFMPLGGGYRVRQIHMLAAYWALLFVSIHLGMRWSTVMAAISSTFGLYKPSKPRTALLRVAAVAIAVYGVHSSFVMGIGSKLVAEVTMDFWSFNEATFAFFVHQASIVGLCVFVTHYAMKWLQNRMKKKSSGFSRPVAFDGHSQQTD